MARYRTEPEAIEYLVGRIAAEAVREGSPLTEVERKMLYFTESGWTLPEMMEVNAEFERDYDNDQYERKIAGLAREIEQRNNKVAGGDEQEAWDKAVEKLSDGDHYLVFLIGRNSAFGAAGSSGREWMSRWLPTLSSPDPDHPFKRDPGDWFRLWVFALASLTAMFLLNSILSWIFGPDWREGLRHILR